MNTGNKHEAKLEKDGQNKSKVKFLTDNRPEWKSCERQQYLNHLTRKDASTIFLARTRMIDVKNNFRSKYPNINCRACGKDPETQEHVLETCKVIHKDKETKVSLEDIFQAQHSELPLIARKIRASLDKLAKDVLAVQ